MKYVLMFLLLASSMVTVQFSDLSGDYTENMYQRMSQGIELAADASVDMVTQVSVSDGQPVFNQTNALNEFKQILAANMDLNPTTLVPNPGSPYTGTPVIKLDKVIDYSNTASFPVKYVNSTYNIDMEINGPSIVYAIQMPAPRIFAISPAFDMSWTTVAAYPDQ